VTGSSRVVAHAGITFAGLMAANILAYVFYTLVSRVLGVEAYGTFSALVAVVLIVQAPALIAQTVVAKLTPDAALHPGRLPGLVRAVDRVALLVSLAAGLMLVAGAIPLAEFLHVSDPLLVVFAGLAVSGAIVLPFSRGILQGTSHFGRFALSNVAEALGKVVFAPLLGAIAGIRGAVAGLAVGYAAAAAYTFIAAGPHRRGPAERYSLGAVARSSLAIALSIVALNVLLLFDVVLAKRYLDPHTAGLYGAAALASRAQYAVIAFIPTVLLPQAAGLAARGERTRVLFVQAMALAAFIAVASVGVFARWPHQVVTIIAGARFGDAAPMLVWYAYAVAMISLANIVATYNVARGRMQFVPLVACIAVGEIVAVVVRHRAAADLLQTIAIGHTLALCACMVSLGGPRRTAVKAAPAAESNPGSSK
jgi:O-antigen/teichoic acid export membrane protein